MGLCSHHSPCVRFFCIPGSLAIPAPSILLVPPHPSSQEDPIHIACVAPGGFPGANFTLYRGRQVVQLLQAPADQLRVTFNLTGGGREAPGGTFHCQYEVLGEQPQLSDLSDTVSVSFPGKALQRAPHCLGLHSLTAEPLLMLFPLPHGTSQASGLPALTHLSLVSPQSSHAMRPAILPMLQMGKLRHQRWGGLTQVTRLAGSRAGVPLAPISRR